MKSQVFKKNLKTALVTIMLLLSGTLAAFNNNETFKEFLADNSTFINADTTSSDSDDQTKKGFGIKCFWFYNDNQTWDLSPLQTKPTDR